MITGISRRGLMGSTAAAICLGGRAMAQTAGPPVARVDPVTENLYGTLVTDRYRWMETKDAEWKRYALAEGAYAAKILGAIPGRDQLADAIGRYTGALTAVESVQLGGSSPSDHVARPARARAGAVRSR